jgi:hypothetical protein
VTTFVLTALQACSLADFLERLFGCAYLGLCMENHVSVDAAEPPHVLIFQVGSIAPAHALHGDCAFLTSGRNPADVELSGQPAVLAARRTQKRSSELDKCTNF